MSRKRAASKGKEINPHFWVFCEGETEKAYVLFLRSLYRIQIDIIPKIVGNKVTSMNIRKHKQGQPVLEKDRDFLMYDADVPEVLEKLKSIQSATLIASNPCIELWFLLHYKNQVINTTCKECIHELCNRDRNDYKKGIIDIKLKSKLSENLNEACKRAKKLTLFENPSSNLYELIEELENARK